MNVIPVNKFMPGDLVIVRRKFNGSNLIYDVKGVVVSVFLNKKDWVPEYIVCFSENYNNIIPNLRHSVFYEYQLHSLRKFRFNNKYFTIRLGREVFDLTFCCTLKIIELYLNLTSAEAICHRIKDTNKPKMVKSFKEFLRGRKACTLCIAIDEHGNKVTRYLSDIRCTVSSILAFNSVRLNCAKTGNA